MTQTTTWTHTTHDNEALIIVALERLFKNETARNRTKQDV